MIGRIVVYIAAAAVGALVVATISEQRLVAYESEAALAVFAILLGLLNATIVPVVRLLTLPISCLTFGLFALLVNAGAFALAATLTAGMTVTFWGAIVGAIAVSVAGGVIYSLVDER